VAVSGAAAVAAYRAAAEVCMVKPLSGIFLPVAWAAAQAWAVEAPSPSPASDSDGIAWILVGIFIFFAIVIAFTWQLVKSERKQQAKPPQ
jgi:hypothetical protein